MTRRVIIPPRVRTVGPRALKDPRSVEYAVQTIEALKRYLYGKAMEVQHIEAELERIPEYRHWEVRGFPDLDAYLKAELGLTQRELRTHVAQTLVANPTVTPVDT